MIKHKKKSFSFVTILFMLNITLLAFSGTVNATTYYVSTNGSNTAPYDTWIKAATSIQTVIDAASNGDIIVVGSSDGHGSGIYTENVVVNKQVTIQSENGFNTTTVVAANPSTHVFEVTEDNVTITGFSIYGATGGGRVGICIASVTNCTIEDNYCGWDGIHTNYYGIYMNASSNCTINNNTASYNTGQGIYLTSSNNNNLTYNITNNNGVDGLFLSTSSSNTLGNNTASNNTWDGIHIESSSNNTTLNNNTANDNGTSGIVLNTSSDNNLTNNIANSNGDNIPTPGISLSSSSNNTLDNNTANYNKAGIHLEVSSSDNNLTSNTVTHNEFGIYLTESSDNIINSNTMNDNDGRWDGDGIMLNNNCSNNIISNNTMNNDPGDGIEFYNSSNNTIIGNTLDNSGAAMRINYYSSNNTIINNTVINSEKGIVLEEESNYNYVSNNTITGHASRGFEFWENASYNTLTGNNISNNGTYGIWLPSGNYNTIYLNNISNNTTANIYSESSTTTWHSPTTIYYDYNSGTFCKGYLGNYYSDGTHTGSDGIGGTYTITNDNDDEYQLMQTYSNYSLQTWWLNGDNNMYRNNVTKSGGSATIGDGGTRIWKADQAALTTLNFSGSDTWTGQLVFTTAPANGHTFTMQIGSSTDGSDFTAGGPDATLTGDGSSTIFTFGTDENAFTVTTGNYLAFRITSNHAQYSVRTGGAWSYISSPDNSTDYALPVELTTFTANVSDRIVTLNWQTETEVNNYGFDVEKSKNHDWQKIGFVEGHGNSNSPKEYSFMDKPNDDSEIKYRLKQIDIDGKFNYSPIVEVYLEVPEEYSVKQNYPNPFNPTTKIEFTIPLDNNVEIKVVNTLGMEVVTLLNEHKQAGTHEVEFNASKLSSGIYFYKIESVNYSEIKKMILLR